MVAVVSYPLFTPSIVNGVHQDKIMKWFAALSGVSLVSSTYGRHGATLVATTTSASMTWKLYKGPNGSGTDFNPVADQQVTDSSGDLMAFFNFLETHQGMSSSQYLTGIGAGMELAPTFSS